MKKLLFSLATLALTTGLFAQEKKSDDIAKFKSEVIDMGKLKVENPKKATFIVTNIGSEPLIIEQASPTCGCTIGDYTKAPIAPGKTGEITAEFNAKAVGPFTKNVTVKFAGTNDVKSITIKGEVLSVEDYAKHAATIIPEVKTVTPAGDTKTKTVVKTNGKKTKKVKVKSGTVASAP